MTCHSLPLICSNLPVKLTVHTRHCPSDATVQSHCATKSGDTASIWVWSTELCSMTSSTTRPQQDRAGLRWVGPVPMWHLRSKWKVFTLFKRDSYTSFHFYVRCCFHSSVCRCEWWQLEKNTKTFKNYLQVYRCPFIWPHRSSMAVYIWFRSNTTRSVLLRATHEYRGRSG